MLLFGILGGRFLRFRGSSRSSSAWRVQGFRVLDLWCGNKGLAATELLSQTSAERKCF